MATGAAFEYAEQLRLAIRESEALGLKFNWGPRSQSTLEPLPRYVPNRLYGATINHEGDAV